MRKSALELLLAAGLLTGCAAGIAAPNAPARPTVTESASRAVPSQEPSQQGAVSIQPQKGPDGWYIAARLGDSLVLQESKGTREPERTVLFKDGQFGREIMTRPHNGTFSMIGDDRFLVWGETKQIGEEISPLDDWQIWVWDSQLDKIRKLAESTATAKELGIFGNVGPQIKLSQGRILWASHDKTENGFKRQLHLYNLLTDQHEVLAAGASDLKVRENRLGGFDILEDTIAYNIDETITVIQGNQKESLKGPGKAIREMALTPDGLVFVQDRSELYLKNNKGIHRLPVDDGYLWEFTASGHFVSWVGGDSAQFNVVRTTDGSVQKLAAPAIQGGHLRGPFGVWTTQDENHKLTTYFARLPQ